MFYLDVGKLRFITLGSFIFFILRAGVNVNLSEILRGLKKGKKKENYF